MKAPRKLSFKYRFASLGIFFTLSVPALGFAPSVQSLLRSEHERVRFKNTFKTPEEVVQYYCARDASGFVWSGLLDIERKEFTLWQKAPENESFYIAKNYQIQPAKLSGPQQEEATIIVSYEISSLGDAHGTRVPASTPKKEVIFTLRKINGVWKIDKPDFTQMVPIVVESKFENTT